MIHVAICLTDTSGEYYRHALVTAASVLDNTKNPVCLHLVHDETLSSAARESFRNLFERYGQTLKLHHAREIPEETERNVPAFLGKGTLYKIMLPSLVNEGKVLYLDSDIVCLCDVADIFTHDVSGHFLGAVKMGREQGLKWSRKLGLKSDFCINAGVLLLNLEKIRCEIPDYAEQLFEIVRTKNIRIGDQGATNIFFDQKPDAYFFLPEFCNFRTEQEDHSILPFAEYQGKMVHFAGKKPWEVFSSPALYYWKYYSALFPGENVFERMEALQPYEFTGLFSFIMRNERVRRWVNRFHEASEKGACSVILSRMLPSRRGKGPQ